MIAALAAVALALLLTTAADAQVAQLRVMTFNVWHGGGDVDDGQQKIVDAITLSGADVVGMQESFGVANLIAERLGWSVFMPDRGSLAVLSRYPIVEWVKSTDAAVGARIQLSPSPPQDVVVYSAHFTPYPYAPYQLCIDGLPMTKVLKDQRRYQARDASRAVNAARKALRRAHEIPVFFVGDMNTPSHLDWVPATASSHCGQTAAFPATLKLTSRGLIDAYRSLHPDPAADRGDTWSSVYPSPEPQDRIDQIYYAGSGVTPLAADVFVIGDPAPYPDHAANDWPSDHRAVVAEFALPPGTGDPPKLTASLSLDAASYVSGDPITATFAGTPGNGDDWIVVYPTDDAPGFGPYLTWEYTGEGRRRGPTDGTIVFDSDAGPTWPLPPGSYEAYLLCCDGYGILADPVPFTVTS